MYQVFIDGAAGTTGLRIRERLATRDDLTLITLPDELRKDEAARAEAMNAADIVFLCLPDAAAKQAVTLVQNSNTVVIDTSTAHRTNPNWTYGFPELNGLRGKIAQAKRIANPGCHASGFNALVAPLVRASLLSSDAHLHCSSLTGYSGGGKAMIAQYESKAEDEALLLSAPRMYGLGQEHKHLPEMQEQCGLSRKPIFCPIVADYYAGMETVVSVYKDELQASMSDLAEFYKQYYNADNADKSLVRFVDNADEAGFMSAISLAGTDSMCISVHGNDDRLVLVSRFDNLGKGASGAAIQNMNIVLGVEETTGLVLA